MAVHESAYPDQPDELDQQQSTLDEVLDLLITEFADERAFFGGTPPPLLFGLIIDDDQVDSVPDWRLQPATTLDLLIKPLWDSDDPIDAINAFRAPSNWRGLGLVAASTAHVDGQRFDITLGVVIDRRAGLSARLVSSDGYGELMTPIVASSSSEGQLVEALRNALGSQPPADCNRLSAR